jgi:hypothetical protein
VEQDAPENEADWQKILVLARAVARSPEDDFVALVKIAKLNAVNGDIRFSNWSDLSFNGCDFSISLVVN